MDNGPDQAPTDELNPRRWFLIWVCLAALFMTLLDATIVNVALPSIGTSLHADGAQQQWVVSGYLLAFTMVPIVGGRLGDDRGRRRLLLIAVAGFVLTSLICGLAPNPEILLVGRLLQGIAGGLVNPQVSGLIQQLFPSHERGRAFGVMGLNVGVAQAVGPVVGGLIISVGGTDFGWRLTFLVNVPVGAVAFLLAWRMLPKDRPVTDPRRLDLPGVALLAIGLGALLLPIVEYDADRNVPRLLLILPALAVLAGFAAWERGPARRRGYPLIDTSLFRLRSYSDGLVLAVLYFAAFVGTTLVLSLFLQDGLGFTALQSGLTASSLAVGVSIGAVVSGRHVASGRLLLVIALTMYSAGITAAVLAVYTNDGHGSARLVIFLAPALFLAGLGGGGVITPNQAMSLREIAVSGGSTAGGMLQTAQRLGGAIGGAVLSAVFYAKLGDDIPGAGLDRARHFGSAYAAALLVTIALAVAALLVAVRETHRERAVLVD